MITLLQMSDQDKYGKYSNHSQMMWTSHALAAFTLLWCGSIAFTIPKTPHSVRSDRLKTRGRTSELLLHAATSYESEADQNLDDDVVPSYEPEWDMLLDMSEISNLCDTEPVEVGKRLKQQGRRDVRVEQRTLDAWALDLIL